MFSHAFRAMGTDFTFLVDAVEGTDPQGFADDAERLVRELESRLSRFEPESELSRLNRDGVTVAGDDLLLVTRLALQARAETGGRFDPTVQPAMVAAGYDRSFDRLPPDVGETGSPAPAGGAVTIDLAHRTIRLGERVALDLGGIAKGYAAEIACGVLAEAGPCLVNAGGDIATRGVPDSGAWAVGVPTPDGELTIGLADAGLATSGIDRRRWTANGAPRHHIIDPATGGPVAGDVPRVTVVADTAIRAETVATALFLAGADAACTEAPKLGVEAIVVTTDGRTLLSEGLA